MSELDSIEGATRMLALARAMHAHLERQEAARAYRASNRLLLVVVLAAVGMAALTHRAVVMLPRKLGRRTARAVRLRAALSEAVASNERAANACVQKIADAHRDGARTKRNRLETRLHDGVFQAAPRL